MYMPGHYYSTFNSTFDGPAGRLLFEFFSYFCARDDVSGNVLFNPLSKDEKVGIG